MKSKTYLALIRAKQNCIILETLYYFDEIRDVSHVPNLIQEYSVSQSELILANKLIKCMSNPFQPANYHDEFRVRLTGLIEKKIAGEEYVMPSEVPMVNVVDLMTALKESINVMMKDNKEVEKVKPKSKPKTIANKKAAEENIEVSVSVS